MGSSTAHWLKSRDKKIKVGVVEYDPTYNTSATTLSVGGLRQQFSLAENIQIGIFARDFMRNYPESLFGGSTVNSNSIPDVKLMVICSLRVRLDMIFSNKTMTRKLKMERD